MKKMQDFRKWLFVPSKTTVNNQYRLAALMNFSREQLNSVASFDPWYIWQEDVAVVSA